jgi:hypothetical protein
MGARLRRLGRRPAALRGEQVRRCLSWLVVCSLGALLISCGRDEPSPSPSPKPESPASEEASAATSPAAAAPKGTAASAGGLDEDARARLERAWLAGRCALVGAGRLTDKPFAIEGYNSAAEVFAAFEAEAERDPGWAKGLIRRAETEHCAASAPGGDHATAPAGAP